MRRNHGNILLRGGGSAFVMVALFVACRMPAMGAVTVEGHAPPIDYLLALLAFLCANMGVALLGWGGHLLDRVEPSARWKQYRSRGLDG